MKKRKKGRGRGRGKVPAGRKPESIGSARPLPLPPPPGIDPEMARQLDAQRAILLEPARGTPAELRAKLGDLARFRLGLFNFHTVGVGIVKILLDAYEATLGELKECKRTLADYALKGGGLGGVAGLPVTLEECSLPPPPNGTGS